MKKEFTFRFVFTLVFLFIMLNSIYSTNTYVSGSISVNTTWSTDTVFINGNTTVNNGIILTINPGRNIIFTGHYGLYIQGRLLAVGTPTSKITFTALNTAIGWSGIRFVATPATNDTSQIAYCNILWGKANSGSYDDLKGGGIFVYYFSKLVVSNCVLSNNYATYGGAISCYYYASPIIINNIICNNTATAYGGAICLMSMSSPQIINNTIVNNAGGSYSGGIDITGTADAIVRNCIFWGNTAIYTPQVYPTGYGNATYCDFMGGGYGGVGNIATDPKFISPSAGVGIGYIGYTANWGISAGSPCINRGFITPSNYLPVYDINGNLRLDYDTVEMGAVEYIQSQLLCGNISTNTTLSKFVIVNCDVTVNNGVTLTVPAGAKVRFNGHYKLNVQGKLLAVGTSSSKITFTAINTSVGWSGIRFVNTPTTNDTSRIVYCNILYGKANSGTSDDMMGGAVYVRQYSKLVISYCNIANNYASNFGGGIGLYYYSSPVITYNTISNNSTQNYGGGISCYYYCSPVLNKNVVKGNVSNYAGGAIFFYYYSNPSMTNNVISNNYAGSCGGALYCYYYASPVLINNIINNNQATSAGGAIYIYYYSYPQITNNTIVNNMSNSMAGGIYIYASYPVIKNCILWGNTAPSYAQIYPSSYNNVTYSDVSGGYSGIGNITADPLFSNPTAGAGIGYDDASSNWNVSSANSPVVNKGSLVVDNNIPLYDIYNKLRIDYDTIDMGASEFIQSSVYCGNINSSATWSNSVIVNCNISINNGSVLTVSPGTKVKFMGQYSINVVQGRVDARGTLENMIRFSPLTTSIGWYGFKFDNTSSTTDSSYFENCVFQGGKNDGAGINQTGLVYVNNYDRLIVRSCIFANNSAVNGAAIYIKGSDSKITNNLIVNNTSSGNGGGIYITNSCSPLILNNTICNNVSSTRGGGISVEGGSPSPTIKNNIIAGNTCSTSNNLEKQLYPDNISGVKNNDIQSASTSDRYTGSGNISQPPLFKNPSTGAGIAYEGYIGKDWSLQSSSNCIEAGENKKLVDYSPYTDLKGRKRIFGTYIDIGAYEDMSTLNACGHISTNTTWNATNIRIKCDVIVDDSSTLTIAPGTNVFFDGYYTLRVKGRLLAVGTKTDTIKFCPFTAGTYWKGIRFDSMQFSNPLNNDTSKIMYCNLQYGKADSGGLAFTDHGGALFINNYNKIVVSNNVFTNNLNPAGTYGGALAIYSGTAVIKNCTFIKNSASTAGAIHLSKFNGIIQNCIISNNTADIGGGIYSDSLNSSTIVNTLIVNNTANNYGGGIYLVTNNPQNLVNCTFSNNSASKGGGMYCNSNTDPVIKNCIF